LDETSARRILVVRLGAMGDIVHAMPAVRAIREKFPDAAVDWVVERRWVPLLNAAATNGHDRMAMPLVDRVHTVETRAWRKAPLLAATRESLANSIRGMREGRYDLAIDFQGAIKSAVVARLSIARTVAGFAAPRETAARLLYTKTVEVGSKHVVEQNLEIASAAMGTTLAMATPLLPVDEEAEGAVSRELSARGLTRFAIVAPTAGWGMKEWPAENFGKVAAELARRGIASLINFGPGEESVAEKVRESSGGIAQPIFCDLAQLIALTRRAALFIGGDTGPMHLAAALGIPVVALFGPTDPQRNGPYGGRSRVLRHERSVTSYRHVGGVDAGLASITPDEVIAASEALLG
jgi:heptosyltransferase-1